MVYQELNQDQIKMPKIFSVYDFKGRFWGIFAVAIIVLFIIIVNDRIQGKTDLKPNGLSAFGGDQGYRFDGVTRSPNQNETRDIYAIVFDAGSTGSRIHVYQFRTGGVGGSPLVLVKETFESIEPGLSAYADDPKKGAESLKPMMEKAMAVIPHNLHQSTPITLKATAGLRLLPGQKAEEILSEVRNLFKLYNFLISTNVHENCVQIMDGVDEGVFSWMTINFLLGKLKLDQDPVAALDLGGGSTQVTFTLKEQATIVQSPKDYLQQVSLFKQKYLLYTHSYLGFGLMSARFELIGGNKLKDKTDNLTVLKSPCFPSDYSGSYKHGGHTYKLRGLSKEESSFTQCLVSAQEYVEHSVSRVSELEKKDIYIFSYFYDRAVDANIVASVENFFCQRETFYDILQKFLYCFINEKDKLNGGELVVGDFETAARRVFTTPVSEQPFLGMDLTYIYALLHHGYKLDPGTKIHLKKKINKVEVSWALGAAFHLLSGTGVAK